MKKKVLLVGEYLHGTGFHRVVDHIKNAIKTDFEVHYAGLSYTGEVFTDEDGVTVYPGLVPNAGQMSHKHIARLIDQIQPDIFFIVYDILYIRFLLEALRHKTRNMKRGAYIALDGEILKRRKMISPLKELDFCIWYTDFAQQQINRILKEQPSLLSRPLDFGIIPHGIDTDKFYPISENPQEKRVQARKLIFPELENPEDVFIVLNANRSVPRKRIDITLKAFAHFVQNKSSKSVKLYLHQTHREGKYNRFTYELIEKYKLQDYLIKGQLSKEKAILENHELNLIYNACDVGINTCMGEGWGLVSFEHAATGALQILPEHTCFPEIWKNTVLWVEPEAPVEVGFSPHKMYPTDPEKFAAQLELAYSDPSSREYYGSRAQRIVQQEQFQWETIKKQWLELFDNYAQTSSPEPVMTAVDHAISIIE